MKRKILIIIWSFTYGGGAERVLATMLNNFGDDFDFELLEYQHFDVQNPKLPSNVKMLDPIFDMTKIKNKKLLRWKERFYWYFPLVYRLKNLGRKKYDYEIAFNYGRPTFLLKKNSICWVHGDVYDLLENNRLRKKLTKIYANTNKIIAISNNTKASLVKVFPKCSEKIVVINNGYDFNEIFLKSNMSCNTVIEDNAFCLVGRLENGKSPLKVLESIRLAIEIDKNIKLYVLGFGPLEKDCKDYIISHDLTKNIYMLGFIDNPFPIMKRCKAIVSLSKSEGFPTIFAESLALGVPFISTNVGGVEELSNDGKCGIIVNSVEECTEAILNYSKIFDSNVKETCIEYVKKFSADTCVSNVKRILK